MTYEKRLKTKFSLKQAASAVLKSLTSAFEGFEGNDRGEFSDFSGLLLQLLRQFPDVSTVGE